MNVRYSRLWTGGGDPRTALRVTRRRERCGAGAHACAFRQAIVAVRADSAVSATLGVRVVSAPATQGASPLDVSAAEWLRLALGHTAGILSPSSSHDDAQSAMVITSVLDRPRVTLSILTSHASEFRIRLARSDQHPMLTVVG